MESPIEIWKSEIREAARLAPSKIPRWFQERTKSLSQNQLKNIASTLILTLLANAEWETIKKPFIRVLNIIARQTSPQFVFNLILRSEVILKLRKPSMAIYDHTLHLIGGGQKYGCTIAQALQNDFSVTLISNKAVSLESLKEWYRLDLSGCRLKVIPLPYFETKGLAAIDPNAITVRNENPFEAVGLESGNYDIFINNSMLEMVCPLSNVSVFITHFPERRRSHYFYVDRYDHLIYNSQYTAEWIQKKWNLTPQHHIYPPVDLEPPLQPLSKKNIILSVARFETGGSKQQHLMIETFARLQKSYPREMAGWRLVLAGGSGPHNAYLEKIRRQLAGKNHPDIDLWINIPLKDLHLLYQQAKIFWHFCGLYQSDPALVEHFGMTIAEAMQNGAVPVVFDGGGQREIVEDGVSGFRFSKLTACEQLTGQLIAHPSLWERMARAAQERAMMFSKENFEKKIRSLFKAIQNQYVSDEPACEK